MYTLVLLAFSASATDLPAYETLVPQVPSFATAKKRMYEIHEGHPTLYCGCQFESKVPDSMSCGIEDFEGLRWERTEAEHIVPASVIGKTRPCWEEEASEGSRSHCLRVDTIFKAAHNDLHNLYPTVGQLNLYRSANSMGLISEEEREYGECDFEVDVVSDRIEPRLEVRGDIARTYFYMEWMYGITLSAGQRRLFLHWHQVDPVNDWERTRNEAIQAKQGNLNPFAR